MKKRTFTKGLAALAATAALAAGSAFAGSYPDSTIRLIVPYKPGGGTDTIARAFATALKEVSGQAVVVENVPGSAGINGMLALTKAEADGYTIAINGSSDVSGAVAFRDNVPFGFDDLTCAGGVFNTPAWILSHKDNGYTNLGDFIQDAKANPGTLNIGITGKMSPTDFVASTIAGTSELNINIVNFGGGGPLKKAILANQVDVGAIIAPVLLADVKAGELNVLAAAGDLSGVSHEPVQGTKHMREWGADLDVAVVRGIWMPGSVSDEVRGKMEAMVHDAVTSEMFTDFAVNWGYTPYTQSADDYCARLPKEVEDLTNVLNTYMQQ